MLIGSHIYIVLLTGKAIPAIVTKEIKAIVIAKTASSSLGSRLPRRLTIR